MKLVTLGQDMGKQCCKRKSVAEMITVRKASVHTTCRCRDCFAVRSDGMHDRFVFGMVSSEGSLSQNRRVQGRASRKTFLGGKWRRATIVALLVAIINLYDLKKERS
jgi:hypothetical protein